jgi:diaminopimelate decarboxylase
MTTLVIQHVKTSELPAQWAQQLQALPDQTVTIRIETETAASQEAPTSFVTDDPAFGIWQNHEQSEDVASFARHLRASRYKRDGSRSTD